MKQKPWNLKQISIAMQEDIAQCHTESEKQMAKTLNILHMKKVYEDIIASGRKLTPCEEAIRKEFLD